MNKQAGNMYDLGIITSDERTDWLKELKADE